MQCTACQKEFHLLPGEADAYARFDAPTPDLCSECRQARRMTFRNEKKLYYNKSFKSGRQIIALYPADSPFRVIDQDEWWDDSFDAREYGREFDFNRPFFEQFKELQLKVPRWSRIYLNCENSDFNNNCDSAKNCYLTFSSHDCEDCYYSVRIMRCKDCIDCLEALDCEYCSQCLDCKKCYNTHFSQLAENCSDSYFLFDCRGCHDCILCSGIRNKSNMILNEQYTKAEYEIKKEEFLRQLSQDHGKIIELFEKIKRKAPHKNLIISNSQNVIGDYIYDSKNIINGYQVSNCEDCINLFANDIGKNCYDCFIVDKSELLLECDTCHGIYGCKFCTYVGTSSFATYCDQCFHLEHSFGCIGINNGKYLILNKEYSKEEYEKLMEKIEEHMKSTGEYGKPFPPSICSFAYNETVAQNEYPLTKEEALAQGYMWYEEEKEAKYFGKEYEIPENIDDIDPNICEKVLTCQTTGKNYKILPQELRFYKKFKLPVPRICPDARYAQILALRNPKRLINDTCSDCGKSIKTTYPKELNYQIICEDCYLKEMY